MADIEGVTTITADFTDSRLTLVLNTTIANPTWNSVTFNGPVFTSDTLLGISGVAVDVATSLVSFDASRVGITDTAVQVNWAGLSYLDGTRVVLDFNFNPTMAPVPEPASLALFAAGLAGMTLVSRRRKGAAATH